MIRSGQNANPHSKRTPTLIHSVFYSHLLNIIKNVFYILLPDINYITCWWLSVVILPVVCVLTEGRSTAMFAFLSCETTHWCFKVPRTEVSTIPLRKGLCIRGRDSQSLWTIASFHASFSSLHPQKMEAVDGAMARPLSLICPVKSAGAAKVEFFWCSSNTVVLSDHSKFSTSETSNRDNYVSRLTNAEIIMSLFNLIVRPGDDSVRRDSFWCFNWIAWGCEIHNPSAVILITFSEKALKIRWEYEQPLSRDCYWSFRLHVDTEQADKACLISYLFRSKAANLWGHPVIFPKLLEGWGVRARYHCHTFSTLSKHAICWDKIEPGSARSPAQEKALDDLCRE